MSLELSAPLLRLKLLDALRNGESGKVSKIMEDLVQVKPSIQTSEIVQLRETVLHYAVQVATLSLLQFLVSHSNEFKIDVNTQDVDGNTPLHLAAASSRLEIVKYLLSLPEINDTITNKKGQQPVEMCKDINIIQLMQFERAKFVEHLACELRSSFTNHDYARLENLLVQNARTAELLDINGADPETGSTVLHEFIRKDDNEMCEWILKRGGDPFKRDKKGRLPIDFVSSKNESLRKLIKSASKDQNLMDPVINNNNLSRLGSAPTYKGYLRKWTNFATGYKLRYFVLDQFGILSYYANQDDTNNSCRGSLNLAFASLHLDSSEKLKFEIIGKNNIRWHLKANHSVETNRWVWTLQNAITVAKDNFKRKMAEKKQQSLLSSKSQEENNEKTTRHKSTLDAKKQKGDDTLLSATSRALIDESFKDSRKSLSSNTKEGNQNFERQSEKQAHRKQSEDHSLRSHTDVDFDYDEEGSSEGDNDSVIDLAEEGKDTHFTDRILSMRRSLDFEIISLMDLLKKNPGNEPEIITTGISSLKVIQDLFKKYDAYMQENGNILSRKLERQIDINRLWESSIRDLENEITERENKLNEYENRKKQLKKFLASEPKVGGETGISGKNYDRLPANAHLFAQDDFSQDNVDRSNILESWLNENSSDEFFDADEFEESEADDVGTQEAEVDAVGLGAGSGTEEDSKELEKQEDYKSGNESSTKVDEALSESFAKRTSAAREDELNQFCEPAKQKLLQINDEGSFLGYDNPPRKTLDMDIDNRPKLSIWGVLKSMVGKDMTKMTLPASLNEGTSLLQRLAEDIEYSELLDTAAKIDDSTLRLVYISAFATSEYSSTTGRIAKPFNPLLGETFEYSRPDRNYRLFVEQVSHRDPVSACHADSAYWDYFGENAVETKFKGPSFDVKHLGKMFCTVRPQNGVIDKHGNKVESELYSWKKVNTAVVGLMMGRPTVDNYGIMEINNHTTGDQAIVDLKQRGWRASSAYQVSGIAKDRENNNQWALGGHWNSKIFGKKIDSSDSSNPLSDVDTKSSSDPYSGSKFLVWQVNSRPNVPFNLTSFAVSLNGLDDCLKPWLPRTDTRLRPDQRAMENGDYDTACEEKNRVEQKQREARRRREENRQSYKPKWFAKEKHPLTGDVYWKFQGQYWKCRRDGKLGDTPDIF